MSVGSIKMVLMTLHEGQEQRCRTCECDGGVGWRLGLAHTPCLRQMASRDLLVSSELCDDLGVGWEGGREAQREGMCVHTQLIHFLV